MSEDHRDQYYWRAKKDQFRSRAAYKLEFLIDRYGIVKDGQTILEIGSSPGGWTQVLVDRSCRVLAVDMQPMDEIPDVTFLKLNILRENALDRIKDGMVRSGIQKFDAVLSDAMAKTSGIRSSDHAASVMIGESVMRIATETLRKGGNAVVKQFQGDMTADFIRRWGKYFRDHRITKPPASRKESSEIYIIFYGLATEATDKNMHDPGSDLA
ncbi:RlmE family RNA methyltransferase [Thermoplasma sp.]|uniref:RlmE family RNA methyltransferase n=1 Tax=Thermoplasma sp. TaxID=1973142 RepID=UPI00126E81FD|nr:RlmE family RNA methyltransferase [Thermoplasma sp.]KAA8922698.1 MAG: RlmE family RNA methyltransferase [Thermoplasma sp.]